MYTCEISFTHLRNLKNLLFFVSYQKLISLPDSINIPKILRSIKRREWIEEFEKLLMNDLQRQESQRLLRMFADAFKETQMEFFKERLAVSDSFEVE